MGWVFNLMPEFLYRVTTTVGLTFPLNDSVSTLWSLVVPLTFMEGVPLSLRSPEQANPAWAELPHLQLHSSRRGRMREERGIPLAICITLLLTDDSSLPLSLPPLQLSFSRAVFLNTSLLLPSQLWSSQSIKTYNFYISLSGRVIWGHILGDISSGEMFVWTFLAFTAQALWFSVCAWVVPGIKPIILALQVSCSTNWATEDHSVEYLVWWSQSGQC